MEDNKEIEKNNIELESVAENESKVQLEKRGLVNHKLVSIIFCAALLIAGLVVGFLLNYRPKMSPIEQRDLATFPTFSVSELMNGNYFSEIALWYADSYPLREEMILADRKVKSVYGTKSNVEMIGNDIAFDEIPDFDMESIDNNSENNSEDVSELDLCKNDESNIINDDVNSEAVSDNAVIANDLSEESISDNSVSANAISNTTEIQEVKLPSSSAMEAEIKQHIQQNLYVKDGAAYSKYYFSLNSAKKYIEALNHAAERLDGNTNVISILIPNQSGAMLPYDEMVGLGGSNQIEAIHYYYSQYKNVLTVDTIDTLREHMDEYLYFRTDHHWTATGAYYVYKNFCDVKGFKPHDLSYYTEMTFDPYLGSFYAQLQDPDMYANPDYVKAYVPHGTNKLVYWDVYGNLHDWQVITDVSRWNAYSGYCCFVGGDKPLAIIENPEITDGSSCLVIKESYGNCFIPYLVDHYQTVYIMDCRYATENFVEYCLNNNIDDLIFINNITIIGSTGVCNRISMLVE